MPSEFKLYILQKDNYKENGNSLASRIVLNIFSLDYDLVDSENIHLISPSGLVPLLALSEWELVDGFDAIVEALNFRFKDRAPSSNLSANDRIAVRAFCSMIVAVFARVVDYFEALALAPDVSETSIRESSLANAFLHPVTWWRTRPARCALSRCGLLHTSSEQVIGELREMLHSVSSRLRSRAFLFGDAATEADALLCGHVCALLEPPPSSTTPTGPEAPLGVGVGHRLEPVRAVLAEAEFEPVVQLAHRVRERYLLQR